MSSFLIVFYRKLKNVTDKTPADIIKEYRLTVAERLQIMDGRILLQPFLNCYERASVKPEQLKRAAYFWSDLLVNESFRNVLPEEVRMCLEKWKSEY